MLRLGQYFKFEQSMFLVGYYCGLMIIREGTMYLGVTFAQEYIRARTYIPTVNLAYHEYRPSPKKIIIDSKCICFKHLFL